MILTADYHTHTKFSHGKGSVLENAQVAKEKGLKEIGITDHGFSHPAFGLTKRKVPIMRKLCDEATKQTGVEVLYGIESNIISAEGEVDLKPNMYEYFDIFLAGIHKFVMFRPKAFWTLSLPDLYHTFISKNKISENLRKTNTKAFINTIKNNPVDVITHLNFDCFSYAEEVAKAAADYGTYIELNAKKIHLSDEELYKVVKTGVNFVINSDAHTPDRVAEISLVEKLLKRVDVPLDRIKNIDGRLPEMRFKAYKERM